MLFVAAIMALVALVRVTSEGVFANIMQPAIAELELGIESSFQAYGQGTFAEIMNQRTSDVFLGYSSLYVTVFIFFPLFLLGLYVGKKGVFQNIEVNLALIKKIWKWSLAIGLTMSIVKFLCKILVGGDFLSFYNVIYIGVGFFGDTGLCLFYITSIILLCQNKKWALRLKPLAYTGRMALSNYLLQSIICTTIFYSYGLGLYGKVGPALGFVLTLAIFAFQIFISKCWFQRYQFGPLEWIWRSLTYGRQSR
jgi:uncharacterized protein